MHRELTNCQVSMERGIINIQISPLPNMQRPSKFKGEHSAKEVDNFLYAIERNLLLMQIKDDIIKVNTISSYVIEETLMWWRTGPMMRRMNPSQHGRSSRVTFARHFT